LKGRLERLETLGFIWNKLEHLWEEGFKNLVQFKEEHGHCLVPHGYVTLNGYQLRQWVQIQRASDLAKPKRERLDELGFVWDVKEYKWEEGFNNLVQYKEEHGDCLGPTYFKTKDGYPLGTWVDSQRQGKEDWPEERIKRLDALGFVWNARTLNKS